MSIVLFSILVLGGIGILGAIILFFTAWKFYVYEDPRIREIEELLPGANCGGCGTSGCHDFAKCCAEATTLKGLNCPSSSEEVMEQIAGIVGLATEKTKAKIAVIRCDGTCQKRPKTSSYDGPRSCKIENMLYIGTTDCAYGCLGCGDCVSQCQFGGLKINPETELVEVDEDICVGCGACVEACPRGIIELRYKGPKGMRVFVDCNNHDRGADARKVCQGACIGCGKCVKECPFGAIRLENNLAYIDYEKCRLCTKCVAACPMHIIHAVNFPVKKLAPAPVEQKND